METTMEQLSGDIEILKRQVKELQEAVQGILQKRPQEVPAAIDEAASGIAAQVSYSGYYRRDGQELRWEQQEQPVQQLLMHNGDKMSKVLAALGNKQRLELLRAVLEKPLTGAELVERLNMGTTGQLYHHLKALLGADLLIQEQGGRYAVPPRRMLPFLLLLAASSELLDTSDYMSMTEVRENPSVYLGKSEEKYDPHLLLWAIVENSILEHKEKHCDEVHIFLHKDGSATVSDLGRGIPVQALSQPNRTMVESTLTDMSQLSKSASYLALGAEKGISIAVVNALSQALSVEIRRDGVVYHQDYKNGIPQSALRETGITRERGTSITFMPNTELFHPAFDPDKMQAQALQINAVYPELSIQFHFNHKEE
jgi:DNA gyrase subunit B